MPFVVICRNKTGSSETRARLLPDHVAYLRKNIGLILASGGLVDDTGTDAHGALIILDTENRRAAEEFVANDPFAAAGIFESILITRWRKAFFDFKDLLES